MNSKIIPVILSGGTGSRLWPLSRTNHPKQFMRLIGNESLFQQTILRAGSIPNSLSPIIVANNEHRFLIEEQCAEINVKPETIIVEPIARNTAPAIISAAFAAKKLDYDPFLLVLPSDHKITDISNFTKSVTIGIDFAEKGNIVVFGIKPDSPKMGYGYLQVRADENGNGYSVIKFVEKPSLDNIKKFIDSGEYFWNSGIFLSKTSIILDEFKQFNPESYLKICSAYKESLIDLAFTKLNQQNYAAAESISIDYAVMERSKKLFLYPLNSDWSDVGSWDSVADLGKKDINGNAGGKNINFHDAKNCYVHSDNRIISLLGVEDLIIVDTVDALLIAQKDRSQDVKKLVEYHETNNRDITVKHRKVLRPWGSYELIGDGTRYQVKLIKVNPGASLSLQKHHHRAEHWVIVSGTAKITIDESVKLLSENQSIYIPIGSVHCLENPGKIVLEVVEVQSGSYLDEDDIIRILDKYGRV